MSQEEQLDQLQRENGKLRAENAQLRADNERLQEQVEQLSRQLHELTGRVSKESHNSSKPPSSDGYAKRTRSLRQKSGKHPGGQAGHPGSRLQPVETPDEIIILRPQRCAHCQASLQGSQAIGMQRRQRIDLPPIKPQVTEYQAHEVSCPQCGSLTQACFPQEIASLVQYGPLIKGIALYLLYGHLLPYARTAELLADVCGCQLSPGTLETFVRQGADRLIEAEEQIKQALRTAEVLGTDETGLRVQGRLQWLHVARTDLLTHYAVPRKGGKAATDAIGILPQFHGLMEHDGYSSYPQYLQCEHALCKAHPLREWCFLHEHDKQEWALALKNHLLTCHATVEAARATGASSLSPQVIGQLTATYHQLIQTGLAAQPPPAPPVSKQRGRVKQSKAKHLLDRLERDAQAVLRLPERLPCALYQQWLGAGPAHE